MANNGKSKPFGKANSRSVTLRDVANSAGVSLATASKSLSGALDVSVSTRENVRSVAAEIGYAPRTRRTATPHWMRAMTMAFDTFGDLYSNELLTGALSEANKAGYIFDCALLPINIEDVRVAEQWINNRIEAGCKGALLVTSTVSPGMAHIAQEKDFILVAIDPKHRSDQGVVSIGATNWAGGVSATEHLLELGHTRIGFVGFDRTADFSGERYSAFRWTMENAGIAINSQWVFTGQSIYAVGHSAGEKLFRQKERPTAVVCVSDSVALGVIEGLRRKGLTAPEDISVVGFDDIPSAKMTSPPLTTVRQPLARMGGLGVRTLLRLMEGREPESNRIQLATELVVRKSTAPLTETSVNAPQTAPKTP